MKRQTVYWLLATFGLTGLTLSLYLHNDAADKAAIQAQLSPATNPLDSTERVAVTPKIDTEADRLVSDTANSNNDSSSSLSENRLDRQLNAVMSSHESISLTLPTDASASYNQPFDDETASADTSSEALMTESALSMAADSTQTRLVSMYSAEYSNDTDETDPYDWQLIESDQVQLIDPKQYATVGDIIDYTLNLFKVNDTQLSLAFYDFATDKHYYIHQDKLLTAASVSKLSLAALYYDLVAEGSYQLSDELSYREAMYEAGNGNITNQPSRDYYTIEALLQEAIIHSDNTAMNVLKAEYSKHHGNFRSQLLNLVGVDKSTLANDYFTSNMTNAYIVEQLLIKLANEATYTDLIKLMVQAEPDQLFTTYVDSASMANKFGRYHRSVNDAGIYYQNGRPQYALVALTDSMNNADDFLACLNLYVNQWYRNQP